ncbi:hypothetical protein [Flavihumibacter petaseus]|uniref:Uncharacterized protein n=1 Tax=Flavihumibacter petaseus NBRC 106054 TaxID=1220578 RepID=A0A0E9N6E5_9BACT|nr:hypothetical protein [Flavihumibacter petaseus]GAO45384.1 hypothetical protein FPE01S_05_00810 [Flavihumibacter petaseus NBRC 106054]
MSPELRKLVERHLSADLKFYVDKLNLKFDWSESCIEGHDTKFLQSTVENFSGIAVFDENDSLVGEGWMKFVHEGGFFLVYWDYITTWSKEQKLSEKGRQGIPDHIWELIPEDIKPNYEAERNRFYRSNLW